MSNNELNTGLANVNLTSCHVDKRITIKSTGVKGLTPAQSAVKLLDRMKLRAAGRMAESYASQADPDTTAAQHWRQVADLIHQTNALNTNAIYEQAEQDAKEMPPKQSKQKPTDVPKAEPERAAWAQTGQSEAERFEAERLAKLHAIVKMLVRKREGQQDIVEAFKERLAKDPAEAMESSSRMFEAAARLRVFTMALKPLCEEDGKPRLVVGDKEPKDSIVFLHEYATAEVLRRSRYASQERSTSPTYNLMEREYLAAWADVIEILTWH